MTAKDELNHILDLIRKYNLPLSPILEYAINEKIELYTDEPEEPSDIVCEPQLEYTIRKELEDYIKDFAYLSVGISAGRKLPHKAILLIGIVHLIENDTISENKIPLDKSISDVFTDYWNSYFKDSIVPSVWTPFYHLKSEPFWHFKAADTEERLQMLLSFGGTPSVGKMRPIIKYAYLDDELFSLLKDERSRTQIREVLIKNYLTDNSLTVGSSVESKVNDDDVLFKKVLDWSMFNAGTTIPTQYHCAIQSVCDEHVLRGGSKHVTIVFEGIEYDAVLRSPDIKGRVANCLQFNWSKNSPLAQVLRSKYNDVYKSLLAQRTNHPGKIPVLPEALKCSLAFCKSANANTYILTSL